MNDGNSKEAFFALLKAGLWKQNVRISAFEPIDFAALYDLADGQSVVGLVAAGLEQVVDRKITKPEALPFMKRVFSLEGRNASMNEFIGTIVGKMRDAGIYTLLVKGQGVAQCYARPQWRSSGDIDFFLDARNYELAKSFLRPMADSCGSEEEYTKHFGLEIKPWEVELHGTLRCGLSSRVDRGIDAIQEDTFSRGNIRTWRNGETDIFLPGADNDIVLTFTHILNHFYLGGIGLRQICDWCRLLWTYRETIDSGLLERRLREMGLTSEWKAFGALAVDYLGMPAEAMPLYDASAGWSRKARRICAFILKVGNFGKNRDLSYYRKYPYLVRKTISLGQRLGDLARHALIFPLDSFRFLPNILFHGFEAAVKEK